MIVHVLLGKERADLTAEETDELSRTLDSVGEIPGVREASWGPDFSGRSRGYTHGAVVHFADRAGLQQYMSHERHLAVVDVLNRLMPDRLVLDYEIESSGIST
jgi:hypothetical protein